MPKATCLVNDMKKEYIIIYEYTASNVGRYLAALELRRQWNLSTDHIFVRLIYDNESYKNVSGYMPLATGGEIIHEYLRQV